MLKNEHRDTEAQRFYFFEKTKSTKNEKYFLCVSVSLCSIKLNKFRNRNLIIIPRHAVLVLKRTLLDVALHLMPHRAVVFSASHCRIAYHFSVELVYPVAEDKPARIEYLLRPVLRRISP